MKCAKHPEREAVALKDQLKKRCGCLFDYQVGMCEECLNKFFIIPNLCSEGFNL